MSHSFSAWSQNWSFKVAQEHQDKKLGFCFKWDVESLESKQTSDILIIFKTNILVALWRMDYSRARGIWWEVCGSNQVERDDAGLD